MTDEVLYTVDLGVILLASLGFFLAVTETGFRLGRCSRASVK